jgi:hypothetical protein
LIHICSWAYSVCEAYVSAIAKPQSPCSCVISFSCIFYYYYIIVTIKDKLITNACRYEQRNTVAIANWRRTMSRIAHGTDHVPALYPWGYHRLTQRNHMPAVLICYLMFLRCLEFVCARIPVYFEIFFSFSFFLFSSSRSYRRWPFLSRMYFFGGATYGYVYYLPLLLSLMSVITSML